MLGPAAGMTPNTLRYAGDVLCGVREQLPVGHAAHRLGLVHVRVARGDQVTQRLQTGARVDVVCVGGGGGGV